MLPLFIQLPDLAGELRLTVEAVDNRGDKRPLTPKEIADLTLCLANGYAPENIQTKSDFDE